MRTLLISILLASVPMFSVAAAPLTLQAKTQGTLNPDGSIVYMVGNGSITIEASNPGAAYQEMQKLFVKSGIHVNFYSLTPIPNTSYKSISVQISPDASQASSLMKELEQLGETKAQNYSEVRQVVYPPNVIEAELKDLKVQMNNLTAPAKPDFETLRALIGKIAEVENKLRSARYNNNVTSNSSSLGITIQSKGFVEYQAQMQQKAALLQQKQMLMMQGKSDMFSFSEKYFTMTVLNVFILAFLLGGLSGWFFTKRSINAKARVAAKVYTSPEV